MTKQPILNTLIKRFYGIDGILDEYQEKELNRLGQIGFLLLMAYNFVAAILVSLMGSKDPSEITLIVYVVANMLMTGLVLPLLLTLAVKRLGLIGPKEVEAHELAQERQKVIRRGLLCGFFFTSHFYLFSAFIDWWFDGIPFVTSLGSFVSIIQSLIAGDFFTTLITLSGYFNIKAISDHDLP